MRRIIWLVDMSLDGFMSGPKGELDWAAAQMDDEMWEGLNELLRRVDAALFGRVTYQDFERYWRYWPGVPGTPASPKNELNFSRWIEATPKIVASTTLRELGWKNSTLLSGSVADGILRMKKQSGRDLLMFGSCGFASRLLQTGLIDELQIRIHPVILGVGRPLFNEGNGRHKLKIERAKMLKSGLVELRYSLA
ncbi:MAG: dihydrofolate reductase family protein [Candidatus Sulfotelmatobacter sp.]